MDKEIAKLNAKRQKIEAQLQKLCEMMNQLDYDEKVPLGVRTDNQEKVNFFKSLATLKLQILPLRRSKIWGFEELRRLKGDSKGGSIIDFAFPSSTSRITLLF